MADRHSKPYHRIETRLGNSLQLNDLEVRDPAHSGGDPWRTDFPAASLVDRYRHARERSVDEVDLDVVVES